jgi:hypothetical protein
MQALRVAAARYRLGCASGESLRDLGVALLSEGNDAGTPLAILDDLEMARVGPVFERTCRALGQPIPASEDAIDIVIAALLRDITAGAVAPEDGLQRLMDDVVRPHVDAETTSGAHEYVGASRRLQQLVGAYWGYDEIRERPTELSIGGRFGDEALALLDGQVIAYAQDWLDEYTG